ncbi:Histidine kinase [Abeliophyllum distichum]|uniref:Histidine kinase n=1 Tax=Abeliophyllum distichum TaxID=126358 RepID=A0ABD1V778_9LAMI
MLPKQQKKIPVTAEIVDLGSSDDEGGQGAAAEFSNYVNKPSNNAKLQSKPPNAQAAVPIANNVNNRSLESRSFWKAGAYEIGPSKSTSFQGDLEHARVHPKFLHSNATSHKWAFGAIAELLDNAVDEIGSGATFVKVDRIYNAKDNSPALLFQDDGGGMDPEGIRKCMSLGYSSKTSSTTIGQYGNGFKTSTMRLGADVIVFSRAIQSGRASVGLLSYTFLRRTGQDDVIVPMVDFDISNHWAEPIIYSSKDDWSSNLNTILEWSPFASKDDLMLQFENIGSHGTKIVIYNLWLNDEGIYELNFDDDQEDIRLRDEANRGNPSKTHKRILELQSHISYRIRFSLRAYASILYLRKFTNFKIILRGKPVQQLYIADDLKYSKAIMYRPTVGVASKEVMVETTIGFIKEAPALGVCGFNVYHKNRLIRPFWKVTADGSSRGHGVVGVLEANFIEPAHDKQDFERSSLFSKLEMRLKQMVMEYWKGHCHLVGHQPDGINKSNLRNQSTVQPRDGANMQKQSATDSHMHPVRPVIDLADDLQHQLPGQQTGTSGTSGSGKSPTVTGPVAGSAGEASLDGLNSRSIDQISEENIQLFNRCHEYIEKEVELKKTIEELENELEETRNKCARLSSHLESQRMQVITRQRS